MQKWVPPYFIPPETQCRWLVMLLLACSALEPWGNCINAKPKICCPRLTLKCYCINLPLHSSIRQVYKTLGSSASRESHRDENGTQLLFCDTQRHPTQLLQSEGDKGGIQDPEAWHTSLTAAWQVCPQEPFDVGDRWEKRTLKCPPTQSSKARALTPGSGTQFTAA